MIRKPITQERLRELVNYDKSTGVFTWKESTEFQPDRKGKRAGSVRPDGYYSIQLDGRRYYLHRMAWLFVHGTLPRFVDHKDTDRSHNWIRNLRPATRSQNQQNAKQRAGTQSGLKNIYPCAGKWVVRITSNGTTHQITKILTLDKAVKAASNLRKKLNGEFANHGN